MRWPLLLVGLLLVAGCGLAEDNDDFDGSTSISSAPTGDVTALSSSTTTSTLPAPASSISTTSKAPVTKASVPARLELRADGLGSLDFGQPTDAVMEALVNLLGSPDPGEEYPYEGHPLRFAYWEGQGLAVVFSDYEFYRDDGVEHLAGWTHSQYIGKQAASDAGPTLLTLAGAEGIGIGATLADLQSAFGDQVVLEAECDPGGPPTSAFVRTTDPDDGRISVNIRFGFEDLPLSSASRIASLTAGAGPGC